MSWYYVSILINVNNLLLCKQIIDDMGRAAARSDQKISRQLLWSRSVNWCLAEVRQTTDRRTEHRTISATVLLSTVG